MTRHFGGAVLPATEEAPAPRRRGGDLSARAHVGFVMTKRHTNVGGYVTDAEGHSVLRVHDVVLQDGDVRLRPLTEEDWDTIAPWETDPEVLWFSEGGEPRDWTIEEWKPIYRDISQAAEMFVIEHQATPVGTGWVQQMNLDFILTAFPGVDIRRVDLQLAKHVWGRGIGRSAISLMTGRAFGTGAELVFAAGIWDYNQRSLRAFAACGYLPWRTLAEPEGSRGTSTVYLVCRRRSQFGSDEAIPRSALGLTGKCADSLAPGE